MTIIQFVPRPESISQFMRRYQAECAKTGTPVSPHKCKSGDPGTFTTPDGDVLAIEDLS